MGRNAIYPPVSTAETLQSCFFNISIKADEKLAPVFVKLQPIWLSENLEKPRKSVFSAVLGCFWSFVLLP